MNNVIKGISGKYGNNSNDQRVQKQTRAFAFSNINHGIYKYMDDKGNIKLPESTTPTTKPGSGVGGGGGEVDA